VRSLLEKMDNPTSLTSSEAVRLNLFVREEINRSHFQARMYQRLMQDIYVKKPFERFMEYVNRFGTDKERSFVQSVYKEVILDRNSELYTSMAYPDVANPRDMVRQILVNTRTQVHSLNDILGGAVRNFDGKDGFGKRKIDTEFDPTNSKLRSMANESPFRENMGMRDAAETYFQLRDWVRMEESFDGEIGRLAQSEPQATRAPPLKNGISEFDRLDNAVKSGLYLAENVLVPTVRTSSNVSDQLVKQSAQVREGVDRIEDIFSKNNHKLSETTRDEISRQTDGLTPQSITPIVLRAVYAALPSISPAQSGDPQDNEFVTNLTQSLGFVLSEIDHQSLTGNAINDAAMLQQAINASVESLGDSLSNDQVRDLKDVMALSINPAMDFNGLSQIAARKQLVKAVVGDNSEEFIANMPYAAQTNDALFKRYIGINAKQWQYNEDDEMKSWRPITALRRFAFNYRDEGSENITKEMMQRPIEYNGVMGLRELSQVMTPTAAYGRYTWGKGKVASRLGLRRSTWDNMNRDIIKLLGEFDGTYEEKRLLENYLVSSRMANQDVLDQYESQQKGKEKYAGYLGIVPHSAFGSLYARLNESDQQQPMVAMQEHFAVDQVPGDEKSTVEKMNKAQSFFTSLSKRPSIHKLTAFVNAAKPEKKIEVFASIMGRKRGKYVKDQMKALQKLEPKTANEDSKRKDYFDDDYLSSVRQVLHESFEETAVSLLNVMAGTNDVVGRDVLDQFTVLFTESNQDIKDDPKAIEKFVEQYGRAAGDPSGEVVRNMAKDARFRYNGEIANEALNGNTGSFSERLDYFLSFDPDRQDEYDRAYSDNQDSASRTAAQRFEEYKVGEVRHAASQKGYSAKVDKIVRDLLPSHEIAQIDRYFYDAIKEDIESSRGFIRDFVKAEEQLADIKDHAGR